MKLHRYYLHDTALTHSLWLDDPHLFHQWSRVLRYETGREVVLFNNAHETKLYKIVKIVDNAVHLELITELEPQLPIRDVYLCFSLLKKDKNEWVLQKATELGVSHFVPLICDRTEKTGWDMERAQKIVTEAAEQCGRSDVPRLRDPLRLRTAIEEFEDKASIFIAEQGEESNAIHNAFNDKSIAIFVGPEGGWSDEEKRFFTQVKIHYLSAGQFTLRAETACIAVVTKFLS